MAWLFKRKGRLDEGDGGEDTGFDAVDTPGGKRGAADTAKNLKVDEVQPEEKEILDFISQAIDSRLEGFNDELKKINRKLAHLGSIYLSTSAEYGFFRKSKRTGEREFNLLLPVGARYDSDKETLRLKEDDFETADDSFVLTFFSRESKEKEPAPLGKIEFPRKIPGAEKDVLPVHMEYWIDRKGEFCANLFRANKAYEIDYIRAETHTAPAKADTGEMEQKLSEINKEIKRIEGEIKKGETRKSTSREVEEIAGKIIEEKLESVEKKIIASLSKTAVDFGILSPANELIPLIPRGTPFGSPGRPIRLNKSLKKGKNTWNVSFYVQGQDDEKPVLYGKINCVLKMEKEEKIQCNIESRVDGHGQFVANVLCKDQAFAFTEISSPGGAAKPEEIAPLIKSLLDEEKKNLEERLSEFRGEIEKLTIRGTLVEPSRKKKGKAHETAQPLPFDERDLENIEKKIDSLSNDVDFKWTALSERFRGVEERAPNVEVDLMDKVHKEFEERDSRFKREIKSRDAELQLKLAERTDEMTERIDSIETSSRNDIQKFKSEILAIFDERTSHLQDEAAQAEDSTREKIGEVKAFAEKLIGERIKLAKTDFGREMEELRQEVDRIDNRVMDLIKRDINEISNTIANQASFLEDRIQKIDSHLSVDIKNEIDALFNKIETQAAAQEGSLDKSQKTLAANFAKEIKTFRKEIEKKEASLDKRLEKDKEKLTNRLSSLDNLLREEIERQDRERLASEKEFVSRLDDTDARLTASFKESIAASVDEIKSILQERIEYVIERVEKEKEESAIRDDLIREETGERLNASDNRFAQALDREILKIRESLESEREERQGETRELGEDLARKIEDARRSNEDKIGILAADFEKRADDDKNEAREEIARARESLSARLDEVMRKTENREDALENEITSAGERIRSQEEKFDEKLKNLVEGRKKDLDALEKRLMSGFEEDQELLRLDIEKQKGNLLEEIKELERRTGESIGNKIDALQQEMDEKEEERKDASEAFNRNLAGEIEKLSREMREKSLSLEEAFARAEESRENALKTEIEKLKTKFENDSDALASMIEETDKKLADAIEKGIIEVSRAILEREFKKVEGKVGEIVGKELDKYPLSEKTRKGLIKKELADINDKVKTAVEEKVAGSIKIMEEERARLGEAADKLKEEIRAEYSRLAADVESRGKEIESAVEKATARIDSEIPEIRQSLTTRIKETEKKASERLEDKLFDLKEELKEERAARKNEIEETEKNFLKIVQSNLEKARGELAELKDNFDERMDDLSGRKDEILEKRLAGLMEDSSKALGEIEEKLKEVSGNLPALLKEDIQALIEGSGIKSAMKAGDVKSIKKKVLQEAKEELLREKEQADRSLDAVKQEAEAIRKEQRKTLSSLEKTFKKVLYEKAGAEVLENFVFAAGSNLDRFIRDVVSRQSEGELDEAKESRRQISRLKRSMGRLISRFEGFREEIRKDLTAESKQTLEILLSNFLKTDQRLTEIKNKYTSDEKPIPWRPVPFSEYFQKFYEQNIKPALEKEEEPDIDLKKLIEGYFMEISEEFVKKMKENLEIEKKQGLLLKKDEFEADVIDWIEDSLYSKTILQLFELRKSIEGKVKEYSTIDIKKYDKLLNDFKRAIAPSHLSIIEPRKDLDNYDINLHSINAKVGSGKKIRQVSRVGIAYKERAIVKAVVNTG